MIIFIKVLLLVDSRKKKVRKFLRKFKVMQDSRKYLGFDFQQSTTSLVSTGMSALECQQSVCLDINFFRNVLNISKQILQICQNRPHLSIHQVPFQRQSQLFWGKLIRIFIPFQQQLRTQFYGNKPETAYSNFWCFANLSI